MISDTTWDTVYKPIVNALYLVDFHMHNRLFDFGNDIVRPLVKHQRITQRDSFVLKAIDHYLDHLLQFVSEPLKINVPGEFSQQSSAREKLVSELAKTWWKDNLLASCQDNKNFSQRRFYLTHFYLANPELVDLISDEDKTTRVNSQEQMYRLFQHFLVENERLKNEL